MPEHPIFAAIYDRALAGIEKGGLREMRADLLGGAQGRTLELGAGTGHNLEHYTEAVSDLVLAEPDPHMAKRLRQRLEQDPPAARSVKVIEAPAEELPFDDGSFDTVVATLVFCTVEDPDRAAAEAKRVLVEEGRLLYLEHVRSQRPGLGRWQDRIERPWGWIAGGCHPNRASDEIFAGAGFRIERLDRGTMPKALPPVRPMILGVARRP